MATHDRSTTPPPVRVVEASRAVDRRSMLAALAGSAIAATSAAVLAQLPPVIEQWTVAQAPGAPTMGAQAPVAAALPASQPART